MLYLQAIKNGGKQHVHIRFRRKGNVDMNKPMIPGDLSGEMTELTDKRNVGMNTSMILSDLSEMIELTDAELGVVVGRCGGFGCGGFGGFGGFGCGFGCGGCGFTCGFGFSCNCGF